MKFVIKKKDKKLEVVEWKEKHPPLMRCGHVAQAIWKSPKELGEKNIWTCVICDGKNSRVIADEPNLEGRYAKCSYKSCKSMEKSSLGLAFFEYHPDREYDEYYCGCHGWD